MNLRFSPLMVLGQAQENLITTRMVFTETHIIKIYSIKISKQKDKVLKKISC